MASGDDNQQDYDVVNEHPAPPGWSKKVVRKKTTTPNKLAVVFVSPTGEEIMTKQKLAQYLKSNPGGPDISEFNWGTSGSPRRSPRLTGKSKALEQPASESPNKKRKSPLGAKGKSGATEDDKAIDEEDANAEETKEEDEKATDEKDANAEETKEQDDKATDEKDANAEETKQDDKATDENDANAEETKEPAGGSTTDAQDAVDIEANTDDKEKKTETETRVEEAKIDEFKEASTEVPGAANIVPKDCGGEGADGKAENNQMGDTESELLRATTGS